MSSSDLKDMSKDMNQTHNCPHTICDTSRPSAINGHLEQSIENANARLHLMPDSSLLLRPPSFTSHNKSSNTNMNPQLQQSRKLVVSGVPKHVCSHHGSRDDDSISTLGSADSNKASGRSIFGDYWGNSLNQASSEYSSANRKHSLNTLVTEDSTISRYADHVLNHKDWSSYIHEEVLEKEKRQQKRPSLCEGYESCLKDNEAGRTVMPSAASLKNQGDRIPCSPLLSGISSRSQQPRRKIFSNTYASKSLLQNGHGYMYRTATRKGNAQLPYLLNRNKKLLRSSLRDRSQSLSEYTSFEESLPESQKSVSFEEKVTVHEYEKPAQHIVNDGWSQQFAI